MAKSILELIIRTDICASTLLSIRALSHLKNCLNKAAVNAVKKINLKSETRGRNEVRNIKKHEMVREKKLLKVEAMGIKA